MMELALGVVVFIVILVVFLWEPNGRNSRVYAHRHPSQRIYDRQQGGIPPFYAYESDPRRSMNDRITSIRTQGVKADHPDHIKGRWLAASSQEKTGETMTPMRDMTRRLRLSKVGPPQNSRMSMLS